MTDGISAKGMARAAAVRPFLRAAAISALTWGMASAAPALAGPQGIEISGQWIRSILPMRPAAGYFTLTNSTDRAVALVGASAPGCAGVMMHQSKQVNGVMQMVGVKQVEVPAHGTLAFAPGGYHIMRMKPDDSVKPGKTVAVTLDFGDGSSLIADFPVKNAMGK